MKKLITSILFLFSVFNLLAQNAEIKFNNKHYNFDIVNVGDTVTKTMVFQNIGKDTLYILAYRSTNKNVNVNIPSTVISPNEYGKIDISFIVTESGSVFEKVDLIINNDETPNIYLLLSGLVK